MSQLIELSGRTRRGPLSRPQTHDDRDRLTSIADDIDLALLRYTHVLSHLESAIESINAIVGRLPQGPELIQLKHRRAVLVGMLYFGRRELAERAHWTDFPTTGAQSGETP